MFENQLEFSKNIVNEYINSKDISDYHNTNIENEINNRHYNDNYESTRERLDYTLQTNINIFPTQRPIPLVYDTNLARGSRARSKTKTKNKNKPHLKLSKNKNLKFNSKNKTKSQNKLKIQEFNTQYNPKGLFDPNMKLREINNHGRVQKQRTERIEKIKNYDLKFGYKVKKLEVYNNYIDMLEDLENQKAKKETNKKSNIKNLRVKLDEEIEQKLPKPKYMSNNLNYNFSEYEDVIKSLEDEIIKEREMRTNINIKYLNKMKEAEELKLKQAVGNTVSIKNLSKKSKSVIKRYTNNKKGNRRTDVIYQKNKYKEALNNTVSATKKLFPKNVFKKRLNSADKVEERINEIKPLIGNMVDKSFGQLCKTILKKNKILLKNNFSSSSKTKPQLSSRMMRMIDPEGGIQLEEAEKKKSEEILEKFEKISENTHNILKNPSYSNKENKNSQNFSNSEFQIDINTAADIVSKSKFSSMNELQALQNINKQIDNYNKGLPQLIEKVETTLEKINKNNVFNENTHPIIKLASKHTGHLIQLHIGDLSDQIIDDLIYECVNDLQTIEELRNREEEKDQFKCFISDYYKNFELMRNFEEDLSRKILSSNTNLNSYSKPLSQTMLENKTKKEKKDNIIIYKNPFESETGALYTSEHIKNSNYSNLLKKNENFKNYSPPDIIKTNQLNSSTKIIKTSSKNTNLAISRDYYINNPPRKYKASIHPQLVFRSESYANEFFSYLKTTGAFLHPNIFSIYDSVIQELTTTLLEEELKSAVRQLDLFVSEIYKEELFKN
jgi:hypothetical protein